MSKLGPKELFRKEDYKEAPPWWTRAYAQLNNFIDGVYGVTVKGISFENIDGGLVQAVITSNDLPYTFQIPTKSIPQIVILGKCIKRESYHTTPSIQHNLDWWIEGNYIKFNITGIDSNSTYDVSLFVM